MTSPRHKDQHGPALVAEPALAHPQLIPRRAHEEPVWNCGPVAYPVQLALLAAAYFSAAKLGLSMAFVAEQVTAVWPPTGIALAALLLFGPRVWPGIAFGAFLANATAHEPPAVAAGITLGNTLEALAGAWLLRRLVQFDPALERVKDVLGLVVLAAGLSTMVSATVGVTSLCLGGVKPWTAFPDLWSVWWLGDAMGNLVVAPLLLTGFGWHRLLWRPRRVAEVVALFLGLVAFNLSVFAGPLAPFPHPALAYAPFPFVIWAALRFGPPPATLATAVASALAVWGTVNGYGPFHAPTLHESLILLQLFMGVVAVTTLVLAAATAERGRAEESLQQSYSLVRAVIDGTTDAVFVKDRQGRYLMINAAGAGFLGKTVADVIGQDDTRLFSLQTARAIMGEDRQIMATGEVRTFEEVATAAGVTRTYLATKGPYRDAQGTILGVIGIARDITERKQAEERFRLVVESAPNGLVMINRNGRIVLVNEQAEKMFGYRRDELLGQPVEVLLPERFRAAHAGHRAGFFTHPTRRRAMGAGLELYGRGRDGREFPVEVGLAPIETAAGPLVLSVVVDITERKRAEEAHASLAAIVEASEDAILSKDLDGVILTWNRAAEKMYGYTAAEVVGRPIALLVPPERAGEASAILERLKRGERLENHETVRLRKDGTRIEVALTISPMTGAAGRVTRSSVIARDITARKRGERRLAAEHAVTRALADSSNLEDAAAKVLQTVGENLGCELGVLWAVGLAPGALRCVAVWHPPSVEVTESEEHCRRIAFARGEGLPGQVWSTGEPAWVPEAPFPRSVMARQGGPCGALAFPLRSNGKVLGVIELFSPDLHQPQEAVLAMLASIGIQVGQFIERRRAEVAWHEREREFRLAREIQQGLFPKAPPALAGLAIAGASQPTQETGGDYFDFIPMADGHWGVAVGDASGHGIGAALVMAETRAYLRALAVTHTDPSELLHAVNEHLAEDIGADRFVTLFLARLDPRTNSLVYSNAGHWPGYVFDAQGGVKFTLNSTSLPLGVFSGGDFPDGPGLVLDSGELVLLVSDGIVEATSDDGSPFGVGRALEVVRAHRHEAPHEIVAALLHAVRGWFRSAQLDDMTAIVIKV